MLWWSRSYSNNLIRSTSWITLGIKPFESFHKNCLKEEKQERASGSGPPESRMMIHSYPLAASAVWTHCQTAVGNSYQMWNTWSQLNGGSIRSSCMKYILFFGMSACLIHQTESSGLGWGFCPILPVLVPTSLKPDEKTNHHQSKARGQKNGVVSSEWFQWRSTWFVEAPWHVRRLIGIPLGALYVEGSKVVTWISSGRECHVNIRKKAASIVRRRWWVTWCWRRLNVVVVAGVGKPQPVNKSIVALVDAFIAN